MFIYDCMQFSYLRMILGLVFFCAMDLGMIWIRAATAAVYFWGFSAIGHNTVCCLPMLLLFHYLFYYLCYTIVSCLGKMCKEQTEP